MMGLALSGCVTMPAPPNYQPYFPRVEGLSAGQLATVFGPPTTTQVIDGITWYTWEHSHLATSGAGYGEFRCRLIVSMKDGYSAGIRVTGNRAGCNEFLAPILGGAQP